ncbi:hypothetical protein ACRC7T_18945 [Segnochrobactraceae bacterium EtOH-i3]
MSADLDIPPFADDPGTGGGFEAETYFLTRLVDAESIRSCLDPVEQVAADWAGGFGLVRNLRDRTATTLTLHYGKGGMPGFFSVSYQIENSIKARVRVDYIALDGSTRSPEFARDLLDTYSIAKFQTSLDAALRCKGKAS